MQPTATAAGSSRQGLGAALLDYSRSPGKHQVAQRQPPVLFAALRDILQIAVGREEEAGAEGTAVLRDPARFFVRTALLYPGADHYALLGLERNAGNADLKDRYRLLMRLLHPDFSGPAAGSWPPDSAVRVNKAYEVLSSAVQRRDYDASLEASPTRSQSTAGATTRGAAAVAAPAVATTRESRFRALAVGCAIAGGIFVVLMMFADGASDNQLVQRARVEPTAIRIALQEETPAVPMPRPSAPPRQIADFEAPPKWTQPTAETQPKRAPAPVATVVPAVRGRPAAPMHAASHASQRSPRSAASAEPPPARTTFVATQALSTITPPLPPAVEQKSEPQATTMPMVAAVQPSALQAVSAPPAPQGVQAPRPAWKAAPTLTEAQPLLSQLLQLLESGRGERILNMLDVEVRKNPSAQTLSRQYDSLVDGARPVRVSHVELKAEPADGRLLVVGHFRLLAGEQTIGALGKKMVLRAEFASREGKVVITGLSGGPVN